MYWPRLPVPGLRFEFTSRRRVWNIAAASQPTHRNLPIQTT